MSVIVCKRIASGNADTVARMTRRIAETLTEVAGLLGADHSLLGRDAALRPDIESEAPSAQSALLSALARDATSLRH